MIKNIFLYGTILLSTVAAKDGTNIKIYNIDAGKDITASYETKNVSITVREQKDAAACLEMINIILESAEQAVKQPEKEVIK